MTNKKRKAAPPTQAATLGETASIEHYFYTNHIANCQPTDIPSAPHRQRIPHRLKTDGSFTTLHARHLHNKMHPGMRFCQLRKVGHPIQPIWTDATTLAGKMHRAENYALPGDQQILIDCIEGGTNG